MKLKKIYLLIIAPLFFIACADGRTVLMQNKEGSIVKCKISKYSAMSTGTLSRDSDINECIEEHENAGFHVIQEY